MRKAAHSAAAEMATVDRNSASSLCYTYRLGIAAVAAGRSHKISGLRTRQSVRSCRQAIGECYLTWHSERNLHRRLGTKHTVPNDLWKFARRRLKREILASEPTERQASIQKLRSRVSLEAQVSCSLAAAVFSGCQLTSAVLAELDQTKCLL